MARNSAVPKPNESSKALNRLPYLASPLLRFNLSDELRQLRNEDSWQRETGRSSKTLAKYPDFRIVLVLMKANTQMKEHHADARISIHTLQGRIRVHLPDQKIELPAGELMALDHGVPHDVEAVEESAFLITIGAAIPGCKWVCLGDYANSRGAADMGLYPDLLPGYIPLSHGAAFREAWDAEFPTQSGLNLLQMMEAAKGGLLKVGNLHEHLR